MLITLFILIVHFNLPLVYVGTLQLQHLVSGKMEELFGSSPPAVLASVCHRIVPVGKVVE